MIANIDKSNNIRGTLNYNNDKIDEETASVLWTNNIINGVDCSRQDMLNSFAKRLEKHKLYGKSNFENTITHISLNPAPEDKIDDTVLIEIAEEYMEKMGYADQPYIVYKHTDIDRPHLHIVTTDVLESGKRINTSQERRRSKSITDAIEKKYALGRADIRNNPHILYKPEKINHKNPKIGQQIKNVARHFIEEYNFASINEFATMFAPYNINLQQVTGKYDDGNKYAGLVYGATNNSGEKIATPIKASSLGKIFGYKNLYRKAFKDKDTVKQKIKFGRTRNILKAEMKSAKGIKDLQRRLKEKNIDIVFRKNEQGRIYGATVIDHEEKFVANGSKFGKEFSANAFETFSQNRQEWNIPDISDFGFDTYGGGFENISGSANDISRGRRNEAIDDEDEYKKRKKKKKKVVYYIN